MALKKGTILLSSMDKKKLKALGQRIREVRLKKDLSFYDLTGEDLPIKSRQHWQRIENGGLNITFTTFLKIAKSLEIEPAELLKE